MATQTDLSGFMPTNDDTPAKNPDTITLYEARPPRVDDPLSITWMHEDLAKSGLQLEDVRAYPIAAMAMGTVGAYVIGYERPEMWVKRINRAQDKYIGPKGLTDIWSSPHQDLSTFDRGEVLYIIEGEKKTARFIKQWPMLNALGIRGCRGFSEKAANGNSQLARKIMQAVRPSTRVIAIFDGDIETNPQIKQAAHGFDYFVRQLGTHLEVFRPPLGKGVDDWLQEDAAAQLVDLVPVDLGTVDENRKQILKASGVTVDVDGKFVKNENNALKIINYIFKAEIRNDKRLGMIHQGLTGADSGLVESDVCLWMQEHIAAHFNMSTLTRAYDMFLRTIKSDLVQNLVRNLEWDGTPRLNFWGSKYFETDIPTQADDWGRILVTGMTLRILEPGTKVDYAFILVGKQGIGKTTFLEALSTFDGFRFYAPLTEVPKGGADSGRTMSIAFAQSVIVDLAEGMVFDARISSIEAVKQLITQTEDGHRPVYAKHMQVDKRGFIFCGTTNRKDHLSDPSGSRRFLNLEAHAIKRLPYEEKLQIIAEVVAKRNEILESEWWRSHIDIASVPQALRDANPHISNVQELINTQYRRPDAIQDDVLQLLENGDVACLKENARVFVLSAAYVCVKTGAATDSKTRNNMARALNGLVTSQNFPFTVTITRKRLGQLVATEQQKLAYSNLVLNDQGMFNAFLCTKKEP